MINLQAFVKVFAFKVKSISSSNRLDEQVIIKALVLTDIILEISSNTITTQIHYTFHKKYLAHKSDQVIFSLFIVPTHRAIHTPKRTPVKLCDLATSLHNKNSVTETVTYFSVYRFVSCSTAKRKSGKFVYMFQPGGRQSGISGSVPWNNFIQTYCTREP